jgi:predicted nucleotidyltransferase component of viral defense system
MGGIHMAISKKAVEEIAKERKFNARTIEKVLRLMAVLNEIADIDALKSKLVLKGGTALNLFLLDLPRLSVDIDLNYIGALNVEEMKLEKVEIEKNTEEDLRKAWYEYADRTDRTCWWQVGSSISKRSGR